MEKDEFREEIDKKIKQLRDVMIQKYNEQIDKIDKSISDAKESAIEAVVLNRAALVKELDDRLALIKQFPSVLEADQVDLMNFETDYEIRMEFSGSFPRGRPPDIHFGRGKWKVLILTKKVD